MRPTNQRSLKKGVEIAAAQALLFAEPQSGNTNTLVNHSRPLRSARKRRNKEKNVRQSTLEKKSETRV